MVLYLRNLCLAIGYKKISLMFSSINFMVYDFLKWIFTFGLRKELTSISPHGYSVIPVHIIEKTFLSPLNYLHRYFENQLAIYALLCFMVYKLYSNKTINNTIKNCPHDLYYTFWQCESASLPIKRRNSFFQPLVLDLTMCFVLVK